MLKATVGDVDKFSFLEGAGNIAKHIIILKTKGKNKGVCVSTT